LNDESFLKGATQVEQQEADAIRAELGRCQGTGQQDGGCEIREADEGLVETGEVPFASDVAGEEADDPLPTPRTRDGADAV
jgi:hypothetical protein